MGKRRRELLAALALVSACAVDHPRPSTAPASQPPIPRPARREVGTAAAALDAAADTAWLDAAGDAAHLDAAAPTAAREAAPVTGQPDAGAPLAGPSEAQVDPTVRTRLTQAVRAPWLFRAGARGRFALGRRLFDTEERLRKAGQWHEELRTGCSYGARLLVSDGHGRLRAAFEETGTEDDEAILRYFFDAHERLRLLYVDYGDIDNGAAEWLIAVDAHGAMSACNRHVVHSSDVPRPDICHVLAHSARVDPAVRAAVRPRPDPSGETRGVRELLDVDAASLRVPCR